VFAPPVKRDMIGGARNVAPREAATMGSARRSRCAAARPRHTTAPRWREVRIRVPPRRQLHALPTVGRVGGSDSRWTGTPQYQHSNANSRSPSRVAATADGSDYDTGSSLEKVSSKVVSTPRRATSPIIRSFAQCSSASTLPSSVEAKPHCRREAELIRIGEFRCLRNAAPDLVFDSSCPPLVVARPSTVTRSFGNWRSRSTIVIHG
jgi:hypothetical protein